MWRRPRFPPYVADTALALLLAIGTVGTLVGDEQLARPWWFVAPLAALTALPLAFRRYRPLAVFAVTLGAHVVLNISSLETAAPGVAVATYTLAAHCDRRTAFRAGLVGLALFVPAYLYASGGSVVPASVFLAAAWLLGAYLRTRREYLRELEEKADRLERERGENERRAVAEEQARIARELHDVIAHNVSVMTVQAAGAREVFETNPARARDALAAIEATGRDALAERATPAAGSRSVTRRRRRRLPCAATGPRAS
jgi:signal transduction histidine kinase